MKNIYLKFTLYTLVLSLFCLGCDSSNHNGLDAPPPKVLKMEIIDRTDFTHNKHDVIITNPENIGSIEEQLNLMEQVYDKNVKSSRGFYELLIFYNKGKKEDFGIIYTVYDGVVIDNYNTNLTYKNNELEQLMIKFLSNWIILGQAARSGRAGFC